MKTEWVQEGFRYLVSSLFLYLALAKVHLMWQVGLAPFVRQLAILGLPEAFAVYLPMTLGIEAFIAVSVWFRKLYALAFILGLVMVLLGICLSLASLIFRITTDCGCGLMGENEYWILAQKFVILGVLYMVFKGWNHEA